jgi:cytochrome c553
MPLDTVMKKLIVAASLILVTMGVAHADGDAAAGKSKSAACAGCHGADGNSSNPVWPKLAGQSAGYLSKQLQDFKDGKRNDPTMAPMAAPLSSEDMSDLAAYFSSQTTKIGETAEDQLDLGQLIYRSGNPATGVSACTACHGPRGSGNPQAKFPSLSGQNAAYVAKSLKDFRVNARNNDAGQMMRNIAAKMTDAEIDAVAQYVQGLH